MTDELVERLKELSTPHLADACLRTGVAVRCAPAALRPIGPEMRCVGRVRPARHCGSVDVFLEALEMAEPSDVLVVDNGGRTDESCVGDLVTLEVFNAGLAGIAIWGLHRDTPESAQQHDPRQRDWMSRQHETDSEHCDARRCGTNQLKATGYNRR